MNKQFWYYFVLREGAGKARKTNESEMLLIYLHLIELKSKQEF